MNHLQQLLYFNDLTLNKLSSSLKLKTIDKIGVDLSLLSSNNFLNFLLVLTAIKDFTNIFNLKIVFNQNKLKKSKFYLHKSNIYDFIQFLVNKGTFLYVHVTSSEVIYYFLIKEVIYKHEISFKVGLCIKSNNALNFKKLLLTTK